MKRFFTDSLGKLQSGGFPMAGSDIAGVELENLKIIKDLIKGIVSRKSAFIAPDLEYNNARFSRTPSGTIGSLIGTTASGNGGLIIDGLIHSVSGITHSITAGLIYLDDEIREVGPISLTSSTGEFDLYISSNTTTETRTFGDAITKPAKLILGVTHSTSLPAGVQYLRISRISDSGSFYISEARLCDAWLGDVSSLVEPNKLTPFLYSSRWETISGFDNQIRVFPNEVQLIMAVRRKATPTIASAPTNLENWLLGEMPPGFAPPTALEGFSWSAITNTGQNLYIRVNPLGSTAYGGALGIVATLTGYEPGDTDSQIAENNVIYIDIKWKR